jgi:hypothetical protein
MAPKPCLVSLQRPRKTGTGFSTKARALIARVAVNSVFSFIDGSTPAPTLGGSHPDHGARWWVTGGAMMVQKERTIFVLDFAGHKTLAFEASHASAAEALVRKPWFIAALNDFCAKRRVYRAPAPLRARPATATEAALFDEYISEFPESLDSVFIVRLTSS